MGHGKKVIAFIFIIVAVYLLILYWFFPFRITEFTSGPKHSNFSLNSSSLVEMQFYENMRYPYSNISYKIYDCPLPKANEMERAFEVLEDQTILNFYPINEYEEIAITCESTSKVKEGMFIGGEGGPTNVTKTNNFNVISGGSILLIRDTKCKNPNIALHELLHAIGFNHSSNKNNVMYPVVKCYQTMGNDTVDLINELYSYPSYPDLALDNVSASMEGRFLDLNMTVRNHGLINSGPGKLKIFVDNKEVKELELNALDVGAGRMLVLTHFFIPELHFNDIKITIQYPSAELNDQNNYFSLQIKK